MQHAKKHTQMSKIFQMLWMLLLIGGLQSAAAQEAEEQAAEPTMEAAEQLASEVLWDQANTAYINNDYHQAEELYLTILQRGERSAKLYFNLANAYFKREELGQAILYYHRALRLQPGDEDIRYNLSVAEARTKDTIDQIPDFFFTEWMRSIRHLMSANAWTAWSLIWFAVMLGALLFYLLSARLILRKAGFYATLISLLCFIASTIFASGQSREQQSQSEAIVMSSSAAVKSSPDRSATDLFILHEGTKVEITNSLENWCEVMIADGKKGWTERSKIEII